MSLRKTKRIEYLTENVLFELRSIRSIASHVGHFENKLPQVKTDHILVQMFKTIEEIIEHLRPILPQNYAFQDIVLSDLLTQKKQEIKKCTTRLHEAVYILNTFVFRNRGKLQHLAKIF